MSFGDLHTDAGLAKLNSHLATRSYVEGYTPGQADVETYHKVLNTVSAAKYPHVSRWYLHMASFTNQQRSRLRPSGPVKLTETKSETKGAPAKAAKKEKEPEPEEEVAEMDFDSMMDGGGDDDAEVKAVLKKKEEEAAAAKGKKKEAAPVGRSNIIFDVKPEDDTTDMKAVEAAVRAIQMDGLMWAASQLEPIAFGLKKLRIIAIVVDELVSTDDLQERMEALPGVQSTDIHAFNKV